MTEVAITAIKAKLDYVASGRGREEKVLRTQALFATLSNEGAVLLASNLKFRTMVLRKTFEFEHAREPWFAAWRERTFHVAEIHAMAAALVQSGQYVSAAEAALARAQQVAVPHTDVCVNAEMASAAVAQL